MGPPLADDIWLRRGISLLWDAQALAAFCTPGQVVSLRQFLRLHTAGWPEAEYESFLVNNGRTLVVAGLESAIDALPPEEAEVWLCEVVYKAMVEFQKVIGSTEGCLILWIADHKRLDYHTSDDTHYWHCGTKYKDQIPLTRCLFNGAQGDRQLIRGGDGKADQGIGLYIQRIS
jgi:hypothetical protein